MRNLRAKRYGAHVVERGKYRGALHVATRASQRFRGELLVLDHYLDTWVLPQEPEDARMTRIILTLQNILEHEIESAISAFAASRGEHQVKQFQNSIEQGYVSFKSKFEWLFKKVLITEAEQKVMDEIRKIRNEQVHSRSTKTRRKLKYLGTALLTRKAVRQIVLDVQQLVDKLRGISGSKETRGIIPPRFFDDEQWKL